MHVIRHMTISKRRVSGCDVTTEVEKSRRSWSDAFHCPDRDGMISGCFWICEQLVRSASQRKATRVTQRFPSGEKREETSVDRMWPAGALEIKVMRRR